MEENEITTIIKEKTDAIKYAYKDALDILDAYDHQTLTRPEGTYYDGDETIEEVAVNMLYDMIKNPVWYACDKQMTAIKFLLFLDWNDALFIDGEKRISDSLSLVLWSIFFIVLFIFLELSYRSCLYIFEIVYGNTKNLK